MDYKDIFSKKSVLKKYSRKTDLQPVEKWIFENHLYNGMRILEIGVGTGRLTKYILEKKPSYFIGIDYSELMVTHCKKRFVLSENTEFQCIDINSFIVMHRCNENEELKFDAIIFGFNGIDSLSHSQRFNVLRDLKYLLKNNGKIIFSSHNIATYDQSIIGHTLNPFKYLWRLLKLIILKLINVCNKDRNWDILYEFTYGKLMKNYYIRGSYQLNVLRDLGYKLISAYSYSSSLIMDGYIDIDPSYWIYYVAYNEYKYL